MGTAKAQSRGEKVQNLLGSGILVNIYILSLHMYVNPAYFFILGLCPLSVGFGGLAIHQTAQAHWSWHPGSVWLAPEVGIWHGWYQLESYFEI